MAVADTVVEGRSTMVTAALGLPWPVDQFVFSKSVFVHRLMGAVLVRDDVGGPLIERGDRQVVGWIELRVVWSVVFGAGGIVGDFRLLVGLARSARVQGEVCRWIVAGVVPIIEPG
jgi:hypothetical protein